MEKFLPGGRMDCVRLTVYKNGWDESNQGQLLAKKEPVQFMAYDLLKLEGKDLRELPFEQRGKGWRI